uniref:Uncharacterized protein n=1 Tax=Eutreptiella gymnastica TaxID=73025 RepID=A0A7S1J3Y1_9EUGL
MAALLPAETKASGMAGLVRTFRALGIKEANLSNTELLEDHIKRNLVAGWNVFLASPSFYFLWHLVHKAGFTTSAVRSITGSVRIVPFLGLLYGTCACAIPWTTSLLMDRGQSVTEAKSNASTVVMLSGVAVLEAIVELRGCGVAFNQMTVGALLCFVPALIGRLAAGVLVQQQKIGGEFHNVLPPAWKLDGGLKSSLYSLCETLCIDTDFFKTVVGTSVFQHILNGITYVLLTHGQKTRMLHLGRYLTGGLDGTAASAMQQFARTVSLRLGFCGVWNWLGSQPVAHWEAMDQALCLLEGRPAPGQA